MVETECTNCHLKLLCMAGRLIEHHSCHICGKTVRLLSREHWFSMSIGSSFRCPKFLELKVTCGDCRAPKKG